MISNLATEPSGEVTKASCDAIFVDRIIIVADAKRSAVRQCDATESVLVLVVEFYRSFTVFFDLHQISVCVFKAERGAKPVHFHQPPTVIVAVLDPALLIVLGFDDAVGGIMFERDRALIGRDDFF